MSRPSSPSAAQHQLYAARPDAVLLERLRADDALAFAELYDRYWQELYAAAYRKLGSREGAEEVVQDIFVVLWQKRHGPVIEHLPAYLQTAVRYRVLDVFRARQPEENYLTHARHHAAHQDYNTEEAVAADDLALALLRSLRQLPEHTREVFRLSRLEHQTVPEIAAQLNVSRKTVEYHLTRALKALRLSLRDFLVTGLLLWLTG
ncbi:RNA polymerase sigma-70 factor [Hymenobacter amundsenii]|uniref:RNA polymerase sigma-70 factor n=1 Tax=Hymenobacter amundsenii TaxID=2006685 RepID=A0A246FHR1_9BACT|nr:RNA polymerase sigma-70 factor [Hymenobacter amundsenii]OWP62058.1 RNA polymerase sigma-70 factor [Hymenobacter amundsenii]